MGVANEMAKPRVFKSAREEPRFSGRKLIVEHDVEQ
jgi:hypothetical protein